MLLLSRGKGAVWLTVIALIACALFWHSLAATPYLRGYDAYYYAVQADFWYHTGRLRIPDSSVVLYAIGALQYLGISAEQAVRLWVPLSLLLFYATFIPLILRCRSLPLVALLFGWALVSPSIAFVAVELPKSFAVMVLLNVALLLATAERIRWAALLMTLALLVLCHKMALVHIGIVVLFLVFRLTEQRFDWRRGRWLAHALLAALLIVLAAAFVGTTLGRADLLRLQGNNLTPGLISLMGQPGLPGTIMGEIGIATVFVISALWCKGKMSERGLVVLLLLTAFIPAFGSEPLNFGERFALLFPYLALASCAVLLRDIKRVGGWYMAYALLLPAVATAPFRLAYSYPDAINPPYARYAALTEDLAQHDIPMLILHRGMHFYYKYTTRRDAFSYEPEPHWNKQRVWRLVYGTTPEELFATMPASCPWGREVVPLLDKDYTLVREDCFATMRKAVDRALNPQLFVLLWQNDMNPSKVRPAFLYGKHAGDEEDEFPALPAAK